MKYSLWKKIVENSGLSVKSRADSKVFIVFSQNHPEIIEWAKKALDKIPQFISELNVIKMVFLGVSKMRKCPGCNQFLNYKKLCDPKRTFCSVECRLEHSDVSLARRKEAMLKKYGVDNISKLDSIKERKKKTTLKHYGVDNPGKSPIVREQMKQTCLEKYGCEAATQSDSARQKLRDRWANASEEKKNQWILTQKQSMWNKSLCFLKERLGKANLELLDEKEYKGFKDKDALGIRYLFKCNKCGTVFDSIFRPEIDWNSRCPKCNSGHRSYYFEHQISNYIIDLIGLNNCKISDRALINPFEIDILIPKNKIGIECDGLYWHSEENGKDKKYHLFKTEECAKKGIQLIHIFEDEWVHKEAIVKTRLKHILGLVKNKIQARKCEVREIDSKLANKFIEKYHIQGKTPSGIRLGLFYHNHLVAVMTFGKSRFNKKYDWELLRYCTVGNFSIIGGAGKLLSYFRRNYTGSIITYADKRWSTGNMYKQLGFTELKDSAPGYYYINGLVRYNRQQFQKHKLKNILQKFDPNLTEYENMRNNNYCKIWDCGNKVFELL